MAGVDTQEIIGGKNQNKEKHGGNPLFNLPN